MGPTGSTQVLHQHQHEGISPDIWDVSIKAVFFYYVVAAVHPQQTWSFQHQFVSEYSNVLFIHPHKRFAHTNMAHTHTRFAVTYTTRIHNHCAHVDTHSLHTYKHTELACIYTHHCLGYQHISTKYIELTNLYQEFTNVSTSKWFSAKPTNLPPTSITDLWCYNQWKFMSQSSSWHIHDCFCYPLQVLPVRLYKPWWQYKPLLMECSSREYFYPHTQLACG